MGINPEEMLWKALHLEVEKEMNRKLTNLSVEQRAGSIEGHSS